MDPITPYCTIFVDKMQKNCQRMLERAALKKCRLRAMTKTHKIFEGVIMSIAGNLDLLTNPNLSLEGRLCCSTLPEVDMITEKMVQFPNLELDILYTTPIVRSKFDFWAKLNTRLSSKKKSVLCVMIDNPQTLADMAQYAQVHSFHWNCFIKVDTGYHRAGISPQEAVALLKTIDPKNVTFCGTYSHGGNSYSCHTPEAMLQQLSQEVEGQKTTQQLAESHLGIKIPIISIGSTPVTGTDLNIVPEGWEIHPGNYVFYDRQQEGLSSCGQGDIAIRVVASVVSHYPSRNMILIDCGSALLSKDRDTGKAEPLSKDQPLEDDWVGFDTLPNLKIVKMSQEISTVSTRDGSQIQFEDFPLGKKLYLVPNHSCLVASNFTTYHIVNSALPDKILGNWKKTI